MLRIALNFTAANLAVPLATRLVQDHRAVVVLNLLPEKHSHRRSQLRAEYLSPVRLGIYDVPTKNFNRSLMAAEEAGVDRAIVVFNPPDDQFSATSKRGILHAQVCRTDRSEAAVVEELVSLVEVAARHSHHAAFLRVYDEVATEEAAS